MAYEVTLVLRFEDYPPTDEDLEESLDCIVLEREEVEV
jgi:hypothetical protein